GFPAPASFLAVLPGATGTGAPEKITAILDGQGGALRRRSALSTVENPGSASSRSFNIRLVDTRNRSDLIFLGNDFGRFLPPRQGSAQRRADTVSLSPTTSSRCTDV